MLSSVASLFINRFVIRSRLNVPKIEYRLIITVEIYATANGKSRPCVFINFINYSVQEQIPFNFDSRAMEIIIASSHPSRRSIIIPWIFEMLKQIRTNKIVKTLKILIKYCYIQ